MKNKLVITIFLIFCIIMLGFLGSNTYSSYVSDKSNISQTSAGKWEILVNGNSINEQFDFNLFETVNNNHVKDGAKVISPGSYGSATFEIINKSDVFAEYTISFVESSNEDNIPILYSLEEDGEYKELSELVFTTNNLLDFDGMDSISIYWKWDYYKDLSQNQVDNILGKNGNSVVEVTMNIQAEQKVD